MNRRFLDSRSQDTRGWIEAAEKYVGNLDEAQRQWLLTKPYSERRHASFFYEMYQVLNLLEAVGLGEKAKVLEVGSGPGWVSEMLVRLGHDVDGIEPSLDMIDIAESRLAPLAKLEGCGKWRYYHQTLEHFDQSEDFYDCVLFHESLHHIIDERKALDVAFAVLKPGGKIAVDEHAWIAGDVLLECSLVAEMEAYGTLENPFSPEYLDQLLGEAGFVDVRRFHMINGMFDRELGCLTIEHGAQAPAATTNNLVASKPIPGVLSTYDLASAPTGVHLSVLATRLDPVDGTLNLTVNISNEGGVLLMSSARAVPGAVFFALRTTLSDGQQIEAMYRNPLPSALGPGDSQTCQLTFRLPAGSQGTRWQLDMVAEHRYWFTAKGFVSVEIET